MQEYLLVFIVPTLANGPEDWSFGIITPEQWEEVRHAPEVFLVARTEASSYEEARDDAFEFIRANRKRIINSVKEDILFRAKMN